MTDTCNRCSGTGIVDVFGRRKMCMICEGTGHEE